MVCIAAFIILVIIGVFVAFLSIFKRDIGKKYWKMFKKAWGCVWKKVRLQKCETGFKEDVKNTVLSKVIIKHPNWVKPLSVTMEVISIIIVAITVWSLATAIKSLLALWTLGTCNVTKPAACSLGAEVCSIDEEEPKNVFEATGRWFTEWGEIFGAIPDKFRSWEPTQFNLDYIEIKNSNKSAPIAVDILDPGCSVCLKSYQNQKKSGFFEKYNVRLVVFAIQDANNQFKFKNSENTVRYIYSSAKINPELAPVIIDKIFTGKDADGALYQNRFNEDYDKEKTISVLDEWSKSAGATDDQLKSIHEGMDSEEVTASMQKNRESVEKDIHVKGIPTMLYDGGRHTGLYKID